MDSNDRARDAGKVRSGRTSGTRQLSPPAFRFRFALSVVLCLGASGGCYTYTPLESTPQPSQIVSLQLNDQGRVALGETLGPSVAKLEGVVESAADSAYVLRMRSVTLFTGQRMDWTGERVVVGRQFTINPTERRFSNSRTALAVTAAAGAVIAFILTRSVLGNGTPDGDPDGGGPPTGSIRAGW